MIQLPEQAVYTVEDVQRLFPGLPGVRTKNLFLRDFKGKRHLLIVASDALELDSLPVKGD